MYFKKKNGAYWVWSSLKASLDCMPIFKFKTKEEVFDFIGKPDAWSQEVDMTFTGFDVNNIEDKLFHLVPYPKAFRDSALTAKSMQYRVNLIDAIILKGLSV